MKKTQLTLLALALVLGFSFTACDKSAPSDPNSQNDQETASLDLEYGGYTTSDEEPGFGEPDMLAEFTDDADADDQYADDPATLEALENAGIPAYAVRLTWGQLEGDSTGSAPMDWSGYAEVSQGVLAVLKTVRFESGDYIERPRDSRLRVDFVSGTSYHFDGLCLLIIDNDSSSAQSDGNLTITAGPFSRTFAFSELDSLELLEPIDDAGNEFSMMSRGRDVQQFAGGFFAGHWNRHTEYRGSFQGRWINSLGTTSGHLRGIFGENQRGARVMFGKYINIDGTFGGLLAGEWGYAGLRRGSGWMRGRWVDHNRELKGKYRGVWKSGRPGDGRGFFHGRWTKTVSDSTSTDDATGN